MGSLYGERPAASMLVPVARAYARRQLKNRCGEPTETQGPQQLSVRDSARFSRPQAPGDHAPSGKCSPASFADAHASQPSSSASRTAVFVAFRSGTSTAG